MRKSIKYPKNCVKSTQDIDQAYRVTFFWDDGSPEDGPMIHSDWDLVYARSPEEACKIWKEDLSSLVDYEGCSASLATDEEIDEWEQMMSDLNGGSYDESYYDEFPPVHDTYEEY